MGSRSDLARGLVLVSLQQLALDRRCQIVVPRGSSNGSCQVVNQQNLHGDREFRSFADAQGSGVV